MNSMLIRPSFFVYACITPCYILYHILYGITILYLPILNLDILELLQRLLNLVLNLPLLQATESLIKPSVMPINALSDSSILECVVVAGCVAMVFASPKLLEISIICKPFIN